MTAGRLWVESVRVYGQKIRKRVMTQYFADGVKACVPTAAVSLKDSHSEANSRGHLSMTPCAGTDSSWAPRAPRPTLNRWCEYLHAAEGTSRGGSRQRERKRAICEALRLAVAKDTTTQARMNLSAPSQLFSFKAF